MYKLKQIPEDFIVVEIPKFKIKKSGKYTYFKLKKEDFNTEKAIQKISQLAKIPRKNFGYAGNKDKHAITEQYASVKGNIWNIEIPGIRTELVGRGDTPISLGDLNGNKFTIVVRNILIKPEKVKFIVNYFDEQRFGKHNLEIGFSIIRRNFQKASELIDYPQVQNHLSIYPNDYVGGISKIPYKILKLYISAVQSFLFNEVVSRYIKKKTNNFFEVKYKHGTFVFPKSEIPNIKVPLVTFDTEFHNPEFEIIYYKFLKHHNLSLNDFVIREMPLTPFGFNRDIIAKVKNFKIGKLVSDEMNPNKKKVKLMFELPKGSYATLVMKSSKNYS